MEERRGKAHPSVPASISSISKAFGPCGGALLLLPFLFPADGLCAAAVAVRLVPVVVEADDIRWVRQDAHAASASSDHCSAQPLVMDGQQPKEPQVLLQRVAVMNTEHSVSAVSRGERSLGDWHGPIHPLSALISGDAAKSHGAPKMIMSKALPQHRRESFKKGDLRGKKTSPNQRSKYDHPRKRIVTKHSSNFTNRLKGNKTHSGRGRFHEKKPMLERLTDTFSQWAGLDNASTDSSSEEKLEPSKHKTAVGEEDTRKGSQRHYRRDLKKRLGKLDKQLSKAKPMVPMKRKENMKRTKRSRKEIQDSGHIVSPTTAQQNDEPEEARQSDSIWDQLQDDSHTLEDAPIWIQNMFEQSGERTSPSEKFATVLVRILRALSSGKRTMEDLMTRELMAENRLAMHEKHFQELEAFVKAQAAATEKRMSTLEGRFLEHGQINNITALSGPTHKSRQERRTHSSVERGIHHKWHNASKRKSENSRAIIPT